jgi:NADH-quinone oxidoreductase subunit D
MHATYYRPGGVYRDLPEKMPQYLKNDFRKPEELVKFIKISSLSWDKNIPNLIKELGISVNKFFELEKIKFL